MTNLERPPAQDQLARCCRSSFPTFHKPHSLPTIFQSFSCPFGRSTDWSRLRRLLSRKSYRECRSMSIDTAVVFQERLARQDHRLSEQKAFIPNLTTQTLRRAPPSSKTAAHRSASINVTGSGAQISRQAKIENRTRHRPPRADISAQPTTTDLHIRPRDNFFNRPFQAMRIFSRPTIFAPTNGPSAARVFPHPPVCAATITEGPTLRSVLLFPPSRPITRS